MTSKSDTREKILETASLLFQKQGYHATGLNEIIKVSGAPKGSLYYHFPKGKEELALEAIKLVSNLIQKNIENGLSKIDEPIESIQAFIKELASGIQCDHFSVSLLALETSCMSETLRKACNQAFESWIRIYATKLIQGGFDKEKAQTLARVIQLMIEGALTISTAKKDTTTLLIVAEQIPILLRHS